MSRCATTFTMSRRSRSSHTETLGQQRVDRTIKPMPRQLRGLFLSAAFRHPKISTLSATNVLSHQSQIVQDMIDQQLQFSIIAKALDAGVFYQDHLAETCEQDWESAFPAVDTLLPGYGATHEVDAGPAYTLARTTITTALRNTPRGTWAWFNVCRLGTSPQAFGAMSDGAGGLHTEYGGVMTYKRLVRFMYRMELFETRRAYEQHRESQRALACIKARGLSLNHTLRNVKVSGQAFSTAVVVGIQGSGVLDLVCTRQGSGKRWKAKLHAHHIEHLNDVSPRILEAPGDTGRLF